MSLELTKDIIYQKIRFNNIFKTKDQLTYSLQVTYHNTVNRFSKYCVEDECLNKTGKNKYINPMLWQFGHIIFFYSNLILKNLDNCETLCNCFELDNNYYLQLVEFYDSFKTPLKNRNKDILLSYIDCLEYYNKIYKILTNYIKNNDLFIINTYLIMLGILHNEMHNEAFIFTRLSLNNKLNFNLTNDDKTKLIRKIELVSYSKGKFMQGSDYKNNKDYLLFDNEMPQFIKEVNSFKISKYTITEFQFLQFILNNGYQEKKYWSTQGYDWKVENNIKMPLYWHKENNKNYYYKKINNQKFSVKTNLPIIHISFYEAEAYCNWKGGRLPTESEYEYVSTNEGNTVYPWGDNKNHIHCSNVNYDSYIRPVNDDMYVKSQNYKGMFHLIGNVWEWCQEAIYPYDGFEIDAVYREMSYPFFGFKKICKGGCFAVPDFLIHPKYRNAQYPDCRIQFIGFRIVFDD